MEDNQNITTQNTPSDNDSGTVEIEFQKYKYNVIHNACIVAAIQLNFKPRKDFVENGPINVYKKKLFGGKITNVSINFIQNEKSIIVIVNAVDGDNNPEQKIAERIVGELKHIINTYK
jgi:hypothetical protein